MSFNAEWTNADALAFRPYTAYVSAPVTYSATTDPMSDLQRENAKLRELVSVMAYCIQGWRECDGCRVNGGAGIITERAGCHVLLDRLRELGVEVVDE